MLLHKKLRGASLVILLITLPLALFVVPAVAHTDDEDPDHTHDQGETVEQRQEDREARQQDREDRREERREMRCERVRSVVQRVIDILEGNKGRLISRLDKVEDKLNSTINRLKEQNIDTANLEAAVARFSEQKGLAKQDIEEGISLLSQAIDLICHNDEANPKDLITQANASFKSAKEHIRAAVDIFKDEIVPELRDAFGQLESN
ncbi:MAG: hypothetical protein ACE5DX_02855 [Candidatus Dojkabacteria bacterium]